MTILSANEIDYFGHSESYSSNVLCAFCEGLNLCWNCIVVYYQW